MAEKKSVKVKLVTNSVSSQVGESEYHYGLNFIHEQNKDVHTLVCEAELELVQSLLDAKLVLKV